MPLQKTYLSVQHKDTFGVITSPECNIVYDATCKFAFAAALHDIHIWSLAEKKKIATLQQPANDSSNDVGSKPSRVTCLLLATQSDNSSDTRLISGHHDGSIKVWDYKEQRLVLTLHGHNSRVTTLAFNEGGTKMASGGFDTDIIVWDMLEQRGLFRLRGHVKPVTKVQFLNCSGHGSNANVYESGSQHDQIDATEMLLSSSRDTSLKLWSLQTQHCVQTIVGHKHEIWSFDVSKDKQFLVSGGAESEVYVWKIERHSPEQELLSDADSDAAGDDDQHMNEDEDTVISAVSSLRIRALGAVQCATAMGVGKRVMNIAYNAPSNLVFAQINASTIHLFYCRTDKEIRKRLQLRAQKEKKKKKHTEKDGDDDDDDVDVDVDDDNAAAANVRKLRLEASDYLVPLTPLRSAHKLSAMNVSTSLLSFSALRKSHATKASESKSNTDSTDDASKLRSQLLRAFEDAPDQVMFQPLLLSYANNMIAIMYVAMPALTDDVSFIKLDEWRRRYLPHYIEMQPIEWHGHRTAIRCVCFSDDDTMIASASKHQLKIWNTRSMHCIRNFTCEYALRCVFAADNKHVIVATKHGHLLLFDLQRRASQALIQRVNAHQGEIYTLCMNADQTAVITGGADQCVKIWKFNLKMVDDRKQLCVALIKSIKMQDEVLMVAHSANGKYLAAALLDNTVQIFLYHTMKFYLTLFGHKLPVFAMDISTDSSVIVTGSADKNIKIWGMDHGDCKSSLFAHTDCVMQLRFVPNTHYFFSCAKDALVKYWDADKFRKIQDIEGHCGEVWSIHLNSTGQLLVSGGADRSLRLCQETSEPLFALREEHKALQSLFDTDVDKDSASKQQTATAIAGSGLVDTRALESQKASKKSMSALDLGEALVTALQLCDSERERRRECERNGTEYALDARLRQFGAESAEQFLWQRLGAVPPCDLEEVLIVLPFEHVPSMLYYLESAIAQTMHIEKMVRCVLILVKYHYEQLMTGSDLKLQIQRLKEVAKSKLTMYRHKIGYNVIAMQFMQDMVNNRAKYAVEANRYKKMNIDESQLHQTWAEAETANV
eukprot:CAMPEP_0202700250 /NCGR_PEP_ID=MMETSP1385-20130828/13437_1 /ASSEMBLY_ACC=CAM_ASM_000861 /TAXON_ID=933848 /ORGANISM="Elphidium margaritaceum" /LENGTH=1055 /DNA_ID=CAMNT_0049357387 /DNA_START=28 /DNA_END=3195 /DNA_ORIENTATION=-